MGDRLEPISPASSSSSAHAARGLTSAEAAHLLRKHGRNEQSTSRPSRWFILLLRGVLFQPTFVLFFIITIILYSVQNYIVASILITITLALALLDLYRTMSASSAVEVLQTSLRPTTTVLRDGKWLTSFDARLLVPGDVIELAAGTAVPADCTVLEGQVAVDESAMTGESLPVTIHAGEMAKMGGTVVRGEVRCIVELTGKDTFFGKTSAFVSSSEPGPSNVLKLLRQILVLLCALTVLLCVVAFIYLLATRTSRRGSLSFAMGILIACIPFSLECVIVTILGTGAQYCTHIGVIPNNFSVIDDLAGLTMLCIDKTGTISKNQMTIQEDAPTYEPNVTRMELLKQAALTCSNWETPPKDALEALVLHCPLWWPEYSDAVQQWEVQHPGASDTERDTWVKSQIRSSIQRALADYDAVAFVPFDPRRKRTEATIRVRSSGQIFKVTKGASQIICPLDRDNEKTAKVAAKVASLAQEATRALALAVSDPITDKWVMGNEEANSKIAVTWHITGLLTFFDPPREDSKAAIARAESYGVSVRMITGDNLLIAKRICREVELGNRDHPEWPRIYGPDVLPKLDGTGRPPANLIEAYGEHICSADGFAQVFPEHKYLIAVSYHKLGYKVGLTGDGVGDAPALKSADVGIAVQGATDAAQATARIVLTRGGISPIVDGIIAARGISERTNAFLTYRVAVTFQVLFFLLIAAFAFHPRHYIRGNTSLPSEWPSFFSLPVLFLFLIAVINDSVLGFSVRYDYTSPSARPHCRMLREVFLTSLSLTAVTCLSSLLLLHFALDSWNPSGLFQKWGIGGLYYGQIINALFLNLAISSMLTFFSARTADKFFFQRKPHFLLLICAFLGHVLIVILALTWPRSTLEHIPVFGLGGQKMALWVWVYCVLVFLIQDCVKVGVWKFVKKN